MKKSILAIVFTACIGMAFASAADDAKALAEKGDADAQFRYAEMLREGLCSKAKSGELGSADTQQEKVYRCR